MKNKDKYLKTYIILGHLLSVYKHLRKRFQAKSIKNNLWDLKKKSFKIESSCSFLAGKTCKKTRELGLVLLLTLNTAFPGILVTGLLIYAKPCVVWQVKKLFPKYLKFKKNLPFSCHHIQNLVQEHHQLPIVHTSS